MAIVFNREKKEEVIRLKYEQEQALYRQKKEDERQALLQREEEEKDYELRLTGGYFLEKILQPYLIPAEDKELQKESDDKVIVSIILQIMYRCNIFFVFS